MSDIIPHPLFNVNDLDENKISAYKEIFCKQKQA